MDHAEPKSQNMEFDEQIDQRISVYKQKMKKNKEGKQTKKTSLLRAGEAIKEDQMD
jgi:hypothetical protein